MNIVSFTLIFVTALSLGALSNSQKTAFGSTAIGQAQTSNVTRRIDPVLRVSSAGLIRADDRDPPNITQFVASSANLVAYARGSSLIAFDPVRRRTLWQQSRPLLFTVWNDRVITTDERGLVTAFQGSNRQKVWSTQAFDSTLGAPRFAPRLLQVIGGILVVSGRATLDNVYTYASRGIDPNTGRTVWSNDSWLERRRFSVAQDRFLVFATEFRSPPTSESPPSVLDSRTGTFSSDTAVLQRTWSGAEYVAVTFPKEPSIADHPVRDSYTVRVTVSSAQSNATVRDLGTFDLTPPTPCIEQRFVMSPIAGQNYAQTGRAVRFLAANTDNVWLEVLNDCNRRIVQIPRGNPTKVRIFDLPEPRSAQERSRLYREGKIETPAVEGRLSAQQRTEWLGESAGLARVRAEPGATSLLWSAQRGKTVYTFSRSKEFRVIDTATNAVANRFTLVMPDADVRGAELREDSSLTRLDGSVFSWRRDGNATDSFYFVLPL
jgi:hypothetical protein